MSFQPILPATGYAGWRFLQSTLPAQQETFNRSPEIMRLTEYFRETIRSVRTAEELVADRRLLQVALGAFGLDDDLGNRFFIRKVLEDGIAQDDSLANRLSDKRYRALSEAFGFGNGLLPNVVRSNFAGDMIARFEARQFERAVGAQNEDLRAALAFGPALQEVVANNRSARAQWFTVLGNPPLRLVVETALGLPASMTRIDLDQQLGAFQRRAEATFGTSDLAALLEPEAQEKMVRLYLIRAEARQSEFGTGGSVALSLLQAGQASLKALLPRA